MNLEKPSKATRKSLRVDMSGLALPKAEPARNSDYRAYVRSHPCALRGFGGHHCRGSIEAAHVGKNGMGSKSSDYSCIPFCQRAHAAQTDSNWTAFAELYNFNPWHVSWRLLEAWTRLMERQ